MEYQTKNLKDYLVEYEITVKKEDLDNKRKELIKQIKTSANIAGYRKGHAPEYVILGRYDEYINEELQSFILQQLFDKLKKEKKDPLHFDLVEGNLKDGKFKVNIEYMPEIAFEYKDYEIEEPEVDINDEHVQEAYKNILKNFETWKEVNKVVEDALIELTDYVELIEGKENNKMETYPLLYSEKKNPKEFYGLFKDVKPGEKYERTVEYGADASESLKNKKVQYNFTVKNIKIKESPEENEELFKKIMPEIKTKAELLKKLREEIVKNTENDVKKDSVLKIYEKIMEKHPYELPPHYFERMLDEIHKSEKEKYEKQYKMTLNDDQFKKEEIVEDVKKGLKINYIRQYIVEHEELKVEDKDIKDHFKQIADANNISLEGVESFYKTNKNLETKLREDILYQKIDDLLYGSTKIKKVKSLKEDKTVPSTKSSGKKEDSKKKINKKKEGDDGRKENK
ncbi:trigger factor [bacterium]|nr:trigger factor [bacterium]